MSDKSKPAFPAPQSAVYKGMSLRDWFAGQALSGLLAVELHSSYSYTDTSREAYAHADAMLKARDE